MGSMSQLEKSYYANLQRSVADLLALKPWMQLEPTDIFAVQAPNTNELLFVQMSGSDSPDEPFQLMAFRGPRGLELLWDLNDCEHQAFVADQTPDVNALLFKLECPSALDCRDLEILEDMDKPADDDTHPTPDFPVFRALIPGFQASHLKQDDIQLLNCVIRQTCEIVQLVSDGSLSLEVTEGQEDSYVIRKPELTDDGITVWHTDHIDIDLNDKLPKKYPKLKRTEIAPLKELPTGSRELRLDILASPFVFDNLDVPTPVTFLFTARDWNSGDLLCARIEEPGAKLQKFRDSLLATFQELLLQLGERPAVVHIEAYSLFDALNDTLTKLGVTLDFQQLPPLPAAVNDTILKHLSLRAPNATPDKRLFC